MHTVYNHVLRLNLNSRQWSLVDNYGDIPGVRMGKSSSCTPCLKAYANQPEQATPQVCGVVISYSSSAERTSTASTLTT